MTDLASAVIARISPRLAAAGMDSQLYVAPELQAEAVTADMTAVEQIVYNLADNAAKYACFDGSVLKVELAREKRFLVIRVEDEGKGISDSLKGKAVPSLFQIRGGGRRKTAGRGAGAGFIPGTGEKHGRRLVPGRKFPRMPLCPQDSPFQGMRACSGKTKFFKSAVIQVLILSSPSLFFKNHFLL